MKTMVPLLLAALAAPLAARPVQLADCPEPVRATIESKRQGGAIDEIDAHAIEGRTLYVAEIELAGDRDLTLHISPDGTLLSVREETGLEAVPEAARRLVQEKAAGAEIDEIEKETTGKTVVWRVEIDRKDARDLVLKFDGEGKLLGEVEEADD